MKKGVVPVSVVKEGEETYTDHYNDMFTGKAKVVMKDSKGMPIGV